jgi:hypothetical protein
MRRAVLAVPALLGLALAAAPALAQERPVETRHALPGYQPSALERAIDAGGPESAAALTSALLAIVSDPDLDPETRAERLQAAVETLQPHMADLALGAAQTGVQVAATLLATMDLETVTGAVAGVAGPELEAQVRAALAEASAGLAAAAAEMAAGLAAAEAEAALTVPTPPVRPAAPPA